MIRKPLLAIPLTLICYSCVSVPLADCKDLRTQDVSPVNPMVDGGLRETPKIVGLRVLGPALFPVPEGQQALKLPNGNLRELVDGWPVGWHRPSPKAISLGASIFIEREGRIPKPAELAWQAGMPLGKYEYVVGRIRPLLQPGIWSQSEIPSTVTLDEGKAPGRLNALRTTNLPGSILGSPDFLVQAGKTSMLSFWIRSNGEGLGTVWYDVGLNRIEVDYLTLPNTDGKWQRAGYYLRARHDANQASLLLNPVDKTGYIDFAGFELRTASEKEMSDAFATDRDALPKNVTSARPSDGEFLALSKAKLAGKAGVPGRPFVVWAIGSSWTNGLGRGEDLRQIIHEIYPNAPQIVYRGWFGSGTSYDFARGWALTGVVSDQPDLVISYTGGTPEALEEMLRWIRSKTTADVVIPSMHFLRTGDDPRKNREIVDSESYEVIRKICRKYGAQFVENRKELFAWMEENNAELGDLLSDRVHQNPLGRILTNENIGRHLVAPFKDADIPDIERYIDLVEAFEKNDPNIKFTGEWSIEGDLLVSKGNSTLEIEFRGNRLDVLGEARPEGGNLKTQVNGESVVKLPAYAVSMVHFPDTNLGHGGDYPRSSQGSSATGPHGILLGKNIVPQDWRIEMIDTQGGYRLSGSKTGFDGQGRSTEPFVSQSGQILIEPRLWRYPDNKDGTFRNQPGDHWTFSVSNPVIPLLSMAANERAPIDARLFALAPLDDYKVIIRLQDGPVALRGIALYRYPVDPAQ